jgi:hypothetical protein
LRNALINAGLHGPIQEVERQKLEHGNNKRSDGFPKIMLVQANASVQHLYDTRQRAQDLQCQLRTLVDRNQGHCGEWYGSGRSVRANMNEASVGTSLAGSSDVGLMSPATEKPTAVKTLMAVISEATRTAVVCDGRIDIQESNPTNVSSSVIRASIELVARI